MQGEDIRRLLEKKMSAEVIIEGEGCDFQVIVVSSQFSGLPHLKRQQMVYTHLNEFIKSGVIHAISMKTMTPQEQNNNK